MTYNSQSRTSHLNCRIKPVHLQVLTNLVSVSEGVSINDTEKIKGILRNKMGIDVTNSDLERLLEPSIDLLEEDARLIYRNFL